MRVTSCPGQLAQDMAMMGMSGSGAAFGSLHTTRLTRAGYRTLLSVGAAASQGYIHAQLGSLHTCRTVHYAGGLCMGMCIQFRTCRRAQISKLLRAHAKCRILDG